MQNKKKELTLETLEAKIVLMWLLHIPLCTSLNTQKKTNSFEYKTINNKEYDNLYKTSRLKSVLNSLDL